MYPFILELHKGLANTTTLFFLIIGVWGVYRAIRGQGVDGSYWGAMVIGGLLFVIQGVLGSGMWFFAGARPGQPWMHVLYGVFAIVFLPFIFAYLKGDDSNQAMWVYSLANLFLFGIALRSIELGV
jgi:hypothetical protein